ncbi:hypothetical protein HBN50_02835 [Halobacteriovorax sp. GB3]|uniref:hypothetical protein n=1 Tax=Halobacteriovorax sp. GB3 TaxID=2719615 RepID=UPI00235FCEC0|nr:hypothetical protein [Halobacteriovorax sp. GB3]MDD0852011.1 hypothetical protein [Halobacteriovorax sp. GB3]
MKIITAILYFISLSSVASYKGELNLENRYFHKDDNKELSNELGNAVALKFSADYQGKNYFLKGSFLTRFDLQDEKRRYLYIEDLFVDYDISNKIKLGAGYRIFNWRMMELFYPSDNVNSRNFDGDLESLEKKGELTFDLNYRKNDHQFSFYYFPLFEKAIFPSYESRLGEGYDLTKYTLVTKDENRKGRKQASQYAIRYSGLIADTDFQLQYLRHIDRNTPVFGFSDYQVVPVLNSLAPIDSKDVRSHFYEVNELSTSFTKEIGETLFKFIGVYRDYLSRRDILVLNENSKFELYRPKDHYTQALGLEKMLSLERGHDVTFFMEWQKVFDRTSNALFQNDLGVGARYALNDIEGTEFYSFYLFDLSGRDEGILSLKAARRLNEWMRYEISYRYIYAGESDSFGLNLFKDDHYFTLNIKSYF